MWRKRWQDSQSGEQAVLEILDKLTRADNLQDVWNIHCAAMAEYGFDRLIYGFTRFATANSVGELEDALFLTNHDPEYFKKFIVSRKFLDAPVVRWFQTHGSGVISWGSLWTKPENLTEAERDVIAFNVSMGVTAGYSVAVGTPSARSRALFVITGKRGMTQDDVDIIWNRHERDLILLCNVTHLKIASLPIENQRPKLSKRQQEVLEWVAEGKSNQDVATIMGVSVPTVEKHLRLAREKLGVDTTAQAITKLTFLNLMYVRTRQGDVMHVNDDVQEIENSR